MLGEYYCRERGSVVLTFCFIPRYEATAEEKEEDAWCVQYSTHQHPALVPGRHITVQRRSGPTWCVSMPSGFIVTRRVLERDENGTPLKVIFFGFVWLVLEVEHVWN